MRNKIPLRLIKYYQKKISPNLDRKCRHTPSCSEYARIAYTRYNFFYASFLTTKRLLKCNRLFKPRYDPVPMKYSKIVKKAHKIIKKYPNKKIAIDATCGNGHDTVFLAFLFEKVYSFDIQPLALRRTEKKLFYHQNVSLILDDFNNINKHLDKANLIIFNLGFLPGAKKEIKTQDYHSDLAIRKAYDLLCPEGLIIVCCYRAHEGGLAEYQAIIEQIKDLPYTEDNHFKNNEVLLTIKKEA